MNLAQDELQRLLDFIGYGNLDAPIWFLGMEEGTGGSTDLAAIEANIRIRAEHFQLVEDLIASHRHFDYDIPAQRKFTQVWLWMAKLARGLEGKSDWQDREKAKDYVRQHLGRADGETFLTELLPLPAKGLSYWPYTAFFETRSQYTQTILPQRQTMFQDLLRQWQPRVVFAYGSQYHDQYRQMFDIAQWRRLRTRKNIEVGNMKATTAVLLPFFGNGGLRHDDAGIVVRELRNGRL